MTKISTKTKIDAGSRDSYLEKLLTLFLMKGYERANCRLWVEVATNGELGNAIFEDGNEKIIFGVNYGYKSENKFNFEEYFTPTNLWEKHIKAFVNMNVKVFTKLEDLLNQTETSEESDILESIKIQLKEIQNLFYTDYKEYQSKVVSFKKEINSIKNIPEVTKEIQSFLKQNLYVIFTNVFDDNNKCNKFCTLKNFEKNFILRSDDIYYYYDFNTETTVNNLCKIDNYSSHIIDHVLDKFRLVSVREDSINEMVQDCFIDNHLIKNNDLSIIDKFYKIVTKSFKNNIQNNYFERINFLSLFSELWNDNLVEKLNNYIDKINFSTYTISNQHQYVVVETNRKLLVMLKLLQEFRENSETDFLFIDTDLDINFQSYMIEAFELKEYKFLVCVISSKNFDTITSQLTNLINNKILNQLNKHIILIAKETSPYFFESFYKINEKELFENCKNIKVDKTIWMGEKLEEYYINRFIISSDKIKINEENLVTRLLKEEDKTVLLSDCASTGKTVLLKYLTCLINKGYSDLWAVYIDSNHYREELKNTNPVLEDLLKIEDNFDREVFTLPGKIVVFIDAIDEVLPENKELICRFLKNLCSRKNVKSVCIAGRANVQKDLETCLGITSYKLLEFSDEDCSNFLRKYQKSTLQIQEFNSEECRKLLNKLFVPRTPLDIKIFAEVFQYCQQNQILDSVLYNKIKLYKTFFDVKKKELIGEEYSEENIKNNKTLQTIFNILYCEITNSLESLAVKRLFDENTINLCNIDINENYNLLWKSSLSLGLTKYCNRLYQLQQRIFAEYLVAEIICKRLISEEGLSKEFAEKFINDIVGDNTKQYYILRGFINDILKLNWNNLPTNTCSTFSSIIDFKSNNSPINLYPAIQDNQMFILKLILNSSEKSNRIINSYNELGQNALHFASKNLPMLDFLHGKGGDLNKPVECQTGNTLLHIADDFKIIEYLLGKSVNIDSVNRLNQTALYQAILRNNFEIVEYLIKNRAKVNVMDYTGRTPLHIAALNGPIDTVKYLVENGADVNIRGPVNVTVMHDAIFGGNLDIFYFLEKHCKNESFLKQKIEFGRNILHHAILGRHQYLLNYYLQEAHNLLKCKSNYALYGILYGKNIEILDYLIKKGADVNALTNNGETVLHHAASGGNLDIVKYLLNKNADKNAKDVQGLTVLHIAALKGHFEVTKFLIEKNADINIRSTDGKTVLHQAVIGGNLKLVKYLINKKVDVNIKSYDGETPLYIAADRGTLDIIKLLCHNKADATISNYNGVTPIERASQIGRIDVLTYFQEESQRNPLLLPWINAIIPNYMPTQQNFLQIKNGTEDEDRDDSSVMKLTLENVTYSKKKVNSFQYLIKKVSDNNRELSMANFGKCEISEETWNNSVSAIRYLTEKYKILLNQTDNGGRTPLHYAAQFGNFGLVKLLTKNKSDINSKDRNGLTPLHHAAIGRHLLEIFTAKNPIKPIEIEHNIRFNIRVQHQININQNVFINL